MFGVPIEAITFDDVDDFCHSGVREGILLDFKKDFPSNLEKAIAAFANTYGGMILIGVDEDRTTGKPILPIRGIPLTKGLRERVIQIGLDAIYPPLVPEVQTVQFKSDSGLTENDRALVLVRVHESEIGSHAVDSRTTVYLRVDNISDPYRKATVEEVEWFFNKRQKSLEEKNRIFDIVTRHAQHYLQQLRLRHSLPTTYPQGRFVFWATPTYPRASIAPPEQILKWSCDKRTMLPNTNRTFPKGTPRPIRGGVFLDGDYEKQYAYTEIHQQGLVYHESAFGWDADEKWSRAVLPAAVAELMFYGLRYALDLYQAFGCRGLVDFEFRLIGVRGRKIGTPTSIDSETGVGGAADDEMPFRVTRSVSEMRRSLRDIVASLQQEVYWSFGVWAGPDNVARDLQKCMP